MKKTVIIVVCIILITCVLLSLTVIFCEGDCIKADNVVANGHSIYVYFFPEKPHESVDYYIKCPNCGEEKFLVGSIEMGESMEGSSTCKICGKHFEYSLKRYFSFKPR